MSADRGFIALAAIIFGRSHPVKTFGAALLFGFFDAVGMRLQGVGVPSQFSKAIPYLFTVIALFMIARRQLNKKKNNPVKTVN
jgi:simple sugar transport system permease protein